MAAPSSRWVVHPFLIGVNPLLFLYAHNIHILPFSQVLLPAAVTLGTTLVLLLAAGNILKDFHKAGILVSLFLLLFFSYGYVYEAVGGLEASRSFFRHRVLLLMWLVFMGGGSYLIIRARSTLRPLTRILNTAGLFLVATQLVSIAFFELGKKPSASNERAGSSTWPQISVERGGITQTYPDIYYIILDEYAEASTLRNIYGYDNDDFLSYLRAKGFYVVPNARSNYANTFLSLASSLNMQHLHDVAGHVGVDVKDRAPAYDLIRDNRTVRFLKARGYKYIHFGSGWTGTDRNSLADVNFQYGLKFQFGVGNELLFGLVRTSLLQPFAQTLRRDPRNRLLGTFAKLAELRDMDGPKFVFAHMLIPHPPYLFAADGEPLPDTNPEMDAGKNDKDKYLNQLIFANRKIKDLLDEILANTHTPPVIVIQSDHGPSSTFNRSGLEDPGEVTDTMLDERMTILNAYYLPGGGRELLYESITPVNTFCIVFRFYFSANCSKQIDESYYSNYHHPYRFMNVTPRIRQYNEYGS